MKTIYINNLNEKVSLNTLKRELESLLGDYPINRIHLGKSLRKKGQAYISFDQDTSNELIEQVIKKYHNYKLLDKLMRVTWAKQDSYELLAPEDINNRKSVKLYKQSGPVNKVLILTQTLQHKIEEQKQEPVDYDYLVSIFDKFKGFENLRYIKSKGISLIEFKSAKDSQECFTNLSIDTLKTLNAQLSYAKN